MSLSASGYATPQSAASSSTSLPSTTSKAPTKPKPVNVFTNDGSFLERFQRSQQEEEDRQKAEEARAKKKQFGDRFKNRSKRPPPDSSPAVTNTDSNPAKKHKLDDAAQQFDYRKDVYGRATRVLKDDGTGIRPLVK